MKFYARCAVLAAALQLLGAALLPCAAADPEIIELVYEITGDAVSVVGCNMAAGDSCPYTGVEIPPTVNGLPVTAIGQGAFEDCPTLQSVVIPASVADIAVDAFVDWGSIDVWSYPESYAETFALEYARSFVPVIQLEIHNETAVVTDAHPGVCNIVIPETYDGYSVTVIGSKAFQFCEALTDVTIPDSVTAIEGYAFIECRNLTALSLNDGITHIGDGAFAYCTSMKELVIPRGVTSVAMGLCLGASGLERVVLPEGVTTIQWDAFSYCSSLCEINIPSTLTSIGSCAFEACHSLTEITIPPTVTSIYSSAFQDTYSVTIYGAVGSQAEEFALAQGIPFVTLATVDGDWNGDGMVSVADVILLHRCITEQGGGIPSDADRNGDGLIDLEDVCSMLAGLQMS